MAHSIFLERRRLFRRDPLADDPPMDRDNVTLLQLLDLVVGFKLSRIAYRPWQAKREFFIYIKKRIAEDAHKRPRHALNHPPRHAAFVHALKRMLAFDMPCSLPNIEHMKRMMRHGTLPDLLLNQGERTTELFFQVEALDQVAIEELFVHAIQKRVSNPIRLDDAVIEWVLNLIRSGNVDEVRIHRLKLREDACEIGVYCALFNVRVELTIAIRPTVMEP